MKFDDKFRAFRNKLRNLNKQQLVVTAIRKLHEVEGMSPQLMKGAYPWYLLLLIRWALEYENKHQYYPNDVDYGMFVRLVNMINDMDADTSQIFLKEGQAFGLAKFLRITAHKQFWLQNSRGSWDLARQEIMYSKLPETHPVASYFRQQVGLSIHDFLALASMVWVWNTQDTSRLSFLANSLFSNTVYNQEIIDAFCRNLSLTLAEMQQYLITRKQGVKNPFLQFAEQTPFIRYPFLIINEEHYVYSKRVLEETIASFVYDFIKSSNNATLINHMANLFEAYAGNCLSQVISVLYDENDLRKSFPGHKVTDFLVSLEQCTILIEVKAIDLRSSVKVYPDNKSLINELRDSVIKAVIQGYRAAQKILENRDTLAIHNRDSFFLLIITYRQLYMGPGRMVWEEFLQNAVISELNGEVFDETIISPDRIIILSIEELEMLMGVLWEKKAVLSDILDAVVTNNAHGETSKLLFVQHFEEYMGDLVSYPFLDDEFEAFWNAVSKKFRSDNTESTAK